MRALASGSLRQPRETVLRIGEVATIRPSFAGARDDDVVGLQHAFGNAANEVLRDARARITRLVTQIPGVAGHASGTLHPDATIRIDALAAVTLLARGQ